jgi:dTDP-4-dehydrorhamnose 3,5-epimerase
VIRTSLVDLLLIEPRVFGDDRGFFFESFNAKTFREATGVDAAFVQDNHSHSARGVLRGLHYQVEPVVQEKLVSVLSGSIFDVVVDLRRESSTFGQSFGCDLRAENHTMIWVPAGFAHGFLVTSDSADVAYKATEFYSPTHERNLRWDDSDLAIHWPLRSGEPTLSPKDAAAESFRDFAL